MSVRGRSTNDLVWLTSSLCLIAAFASSTALAESADKSEEKPPKDDDSFCSKVECSQFASCLDCVFPECEYGSSTTLNCTTKRACARQFSVRKDVECRYCWQFPSSDYDCSPVRNCSTSSVRLFRTTCRMHQSVVCKGRRVFFKNVRCNWSSGYCWWKAMLLSLTLGGFGADRFYLGMWKSAIGKLFSFGGLGIWTLVDVVLIGIGYVGPADGSLYI